MHALIIYNEVTATGNLPAGARRLDAGEWVTPPGGAWTPELAAACGWFEVTETPRPDPIDGGTHESTVQLVDGLPVRVWTWREWTAEEVAWQAEAEARLDDHGQRLARIEAHLWPPDTTPGTTARSPLTGWAGHFAVPTCRAPSGRSCG